MTITIKDYPGMLHAISIRCLKLSLFSRCNPALLRVQARSQSLTHFKECASVEFSMEYLGNGMEYLWNIYVIYIYMYVWSIMEYHGISWNIYGMDSPASHRGCSFQTP